MLQAYLLSVMALRGGDWERANRKMSLQLGWNSALGLPSFWRQDCLSSEPAARAKGSLGAWGTLGDFPRDQWGSQSHPDLTQSCSLLRTQSWCRRVHWEGPLWGPPCDGLICRCMRRGGGHRETLWAIGWERPALTAACQTQCPCLAIYIIFFNSPFSDPKWMNDITSFTQGFLLNLHYAEQLQHGLPQVCCVGDSHTSITDLVTLTWLMWFYKTVNNSWQVTTQHKKQSSLVWQQNVLQNSVYF